MLKGEAPLILGKEIPFFAKDGVFTVSAD